MDEYFKKEYEKKKGKASKEYLKYIYALSLIDGSHKKHLKIMRDMSKFFQLMYQAEEPISEEEKIKIISGKSWVNGFAFCLENIDKLINLKKGGLNSSHA